MAIKIDPNDPRLQDLEQRLQVEQAARLSRMLGEEQPEADTFASRVEGHAGPARAGDVGLAAYRNIALEGSEEDLAGIRETARGRAKGLYEQAGVSVPSTIDRKPGDLPGLRQARPTTLGIDQWVYDASQDTGMPQTWIRAIIQQESAGKVDARSDRGAYGLMQLMEAAAKDVEVDRMDPAQNVLGGARYFMKMMKRYNGNTTYALAAYNAGPGSVEKYSGVPPYTQTRRYVSKLSPQLTMESAQQEFDAKMLEKAPEKGLADPMVGREEGLPETTGPSWTKPSGETFMPEAMVYGGARGSQVLYDAFSGAWKGTKAFGAGLEVAVGEKVQQSAEAGPETAYGRRWRGGETGTEEAMPAFMGGHGGVVSGVATGLLNDYQGMTAGEQFGASLTVDLGAGVVDFMDEAYGGAVAAVGDRLHSEIMKGNVASAPFKAAKQGVNHFVASYLVKPIEGFFQTAAALQHQPELIVTRPGQVAFGLLAPFMIMRHFGKMSGKGFKAAVRGVEGRAVLYASHMEGGLFRHYRQFAKRGQTPFELSQNRLWKPFAKELQRTVNEVFEARNSVRLTGEYIKEAQKRIAISRPDLMEQGPPPMPWDEIINRFRHPEQYGELEPGMLRTYFKDRIMLPAQRIRLKRFYDKLRDAGVDPGIHVDWADYRQVQLAVEKGIPMPASVRFRYETLSPEKYNEVAKRIINEGLHLEDDFDISAVLDQLMLDDHLAKGQALVGELVYWGEGENRYAGKVVKVRSRQGKPGNILHVKERDTNKMMEVAEGNIRSTESIERVIRLINKKGQRIYRPESLKDIEKNQPELAELLRLRQAFSDRLTRSLEVMRVQTALERQLGSMEVEAGVGRPERVAPEFVGPPTEFVGPQPKAAVRPPLRRGKTPLTVGPGRPLPREAFPGAPATVVEGGLPGTGLLKQPRAQRPGAPAIAEKADRMETGIRERETAPQVRQRLEAERLRREAKYAPERIGDVQAGDHISQLYQERGKWTYTITRRQAGKVKRSRHRFESRGEAVEARDHAIWLSHLKKTERAIAPKVEKKAVERIQRRREKRLREVIEKPERFKKKQERIAAEEARRAKEEVEVAKTASKVAKEREAAEAGKAPAAKPAAEDVGFMKGNILRIGDKEFQIRAKNGEPGTGSKITVKEGDAEPETGELIDAGKMDSGEIWFELEMSDGSSSIFGVADITGAAPKRRGPGKPSAMAGETGAATTTPRAAEAGAEQREPILKHVNTLKETFGEDMKGELPAADHQAWEAMAQLGVELRARDNRDYFYYNMRRELGTNLWDRFSEEQRRGVWERANEIAKVRRKTQQARHGPAEQARWHALDTESFLKKQKYGKETLARNQSFMRFLIEYLEDNNITLQDFASGDLTWMQRFLEKRDDLAPGSGKQTRTQLRQYLDWAKDYKKKQLFTPDDWQQLDAALKSSSADLPAERQHSWATWQRVEGILDSIPISDAKGNIIHRNYVGRAMGEFLYDSAMRPESVYRLLEKNIIITDKGTGQKLTVKELINAYNTAKEAQGPAGGAEVVQAQYRVTLDKIHVDKGTLTTAYLHTPRGYQHFIEWLEHREGMKGTAGVRTSLQKENFIFIDAKGEGFMGRSKGKGYRRPVKSFPTDFWRKAQIDWYKTRDGRRLYHDELSVVRGFRDTAAARYYEAYRRQRREGQAYEHADIMERLKRILGHKNISQTEAYIREYIRFEEEMGRMETETAAAVKGLKEGKPPPKTEGVATLEFRAGRTRRGSDPVKESGKEPTDPRGFQESKRELELARIKTERELVRLQRVAERQRRATVRSVTLDPSLRGNPDGPKNAQQISIDTPRTDEFSDNPKWRLQPGERITPLHKMYRSIESLMTHMDKLAGKYFPWTFKRVGDKLFRSRGVRGVTKIEQRADRLKIWSDFETSVHEFAHNLHVHLFKPEDPTKPHEMTQTVEALRPYEKELQRFSTKELNAETRADPKAYAEFLMEGWAEFNRLFIVDFAWAHQNAPRFTRRYIQLMTEKAPEAYAHMKWMRGEVMKFKNPANAEAVMDSLIDYDGQEGVAAGGDIPARRKKGVWVHTNPEKFTQKIIDDLNYFRIVRDIANLALEQQGEKRLMGANDFYVMARLYRGVWGKAEHFLKRASFKFGTWEDNGASFVDILKRMEKTGLGKRDMNTYMISARVLDVGRRGINAFELPPDTARISIKQIDERYPGDGPTHRIYEVLGEDGYLTRKSEVVPEGEAVGAKQFRDWVQTWGLGKDNAFYVREGSAAWFAHEIDQYQTRLLEYARDAELLDAKSFNTIKYLNRAYSPLYRVYDDVSFKEYDTLRARLKKLNEKQGTLAKDKGWKKHLPIEIQEVGLERGVQRGRSGGQGRFVNLPALTKKLTGKSYAQVVNPLESIVKNTYALLSLAERNAIMTRLVRTFASEKGGRMRKGVVYEAGSIIEGPLDRAAVPQKLPMHSLEKAIKKALGHEGRELLKEEGIELDLDGVANLLMPTQTIAKPMVSVFMKGQREIYQMSDNMYHTVMNLSRDQVEPWVRLLMKPTGWLRKGATIYNPEFWVRNIVRDMYSRWAWSRHGSAFGGYWAESIKEVFAERLSTKKGQQDFWEWQKAGGPMASFMAMEPENINLKLRQLMDDAMQATPDTKAQAFWASINHPITSVKWLSEATEISNRIAEFKHVKTVELAKLQNEYVQTELGGRKAAFDQAKFNEWAWKTGKMKDALIEAGFASREATLDFAKIGENMRTAGQLIAFFTANVNGLHKGVFQEPAHWWKTGGVKSKGFQRFIGRYATTTAISATLYATRLGMGKEVQEEYLSLPLWDRNMFWHIPVPKTVRDAIQMVSGFNIGFIRVPKPFEIGLVGGATIERFADYLYDGQPDNFYSLLSEMGKVGPGFGNLTPTALIPIIELMANKSFFFGGPIVPRGREGMMTPLQYGPATSPGARLISSSIYEVSQMIGGWGGISPAHIDNFVYGWTGGLGRAALTGLGLPALLPGVNKPSPQASDIYFLKAFVSRTPPTSSASVNRFYDKWQHAKSVRNSIQEYRRVGNVSAARKLIRRNRSYLRNIEMMDEIGKRMARLRRRRYALTEQAYRGRLSKMQRRYAIDDINHMMHNMAWRFEKRAKF